MAAFSGHSSGSGFSGGNVPDVLTTLMDSFGINMDVAGDLLSGLVLYGGQLPADGQLPKDSIASHLISLAGSGLGKIGQQQEKELTTKISKLSVQIFTKQKIRRAAIQAGASYPEAMALAFTSGKSYLHPGSMTQLKQDAASSYLSLNYFPKAIADMLKNIIT